MKHVEQKGQVNYTTMRIIFNPEFHRYEVYREKPIYRNGQPQPCFVSRSQIECLKYFNRVREVEGRKV